MQLYQGLETWRQRLEPVFLRSLPVVLAGQTAIGLATTHRGPGSAALAGLLLVGSSAAWLGAAWLGYLPRERVDGPGWVAGLALLAVSGATGLSLGWTAGQSWLVGAMASGRLVIVTSSSGVSPRHPVRRDPAPRFRFRVNWGELVGLAMIAEWIWAAVSDTVGWRGWVAVGEALGLLWFAVVLGLRLVAGWTVLREAADTARANRVLQDRSDTARELHDVIAHTLSSLAVDLEGSRLLAEKEQVPADLVARLDRAARLARSGLDDTRGVLGVLRGRELPGPEELPELVARFSEHTATPARLRVRGAPRELASEARVALYRAAQEALTNVTRHSRASSVLVTLHWRPHEVVLEVDDVGEPAATDDSGSGLGLVGMRERAELAGGSVAAGPTATGFRVTVRLPL